MGVDGIVTVASMWVVVGIGLLFRYSFLVFGLVCFAACAVLGVSAVKVAVVGGVGNVPMQIYHIAGVSFIDCSYRLPFLSAEALGPIALRNA